MAEPERTSKENLTFRCPRVLRDWLDVHVKAGNFSSRSEAIVYYLTTAKAKEEKR